jgi:hypothetical protein
MNLVGGLEHVLFSMIYGILPFDFHMFQDGYCTTNQISLVGVISTIDLAA